MKYKVIANPAAGKGAARLLIPKIEQRLKTYGLDFDLVYTQKPWHAADLAEQAAADGYDVVAAAGGDGTFNEVLNGLLRAHRQKPARPPICLGVICIGRGNDFAFGAGLPTDWEAGCRALTLGQRRPIDIGLIRHASGDPNNCLADGRFFGNGIGIGFDAVVNIQATRTRLSGFLGYTVAALTTLLLHYTSPNMVIAGDRETLTQPCVMVSIMNGRRMGGGFYMTPHSVIDDGLLDLCVAHKVSRGTILMLLPRFMKGSQTGHPAIRFMRSRSVEITSLDGSLPIHVDGETVCMDARKVIIEALPGAVEVLSLPGQMPDRLPESM